MAQHFTPAEWCRALPLAERAAGAPPSALLPRPCQPTERARRRLQRWRSQPPFTERDWFNLRLEQLGLREQDLLLLLEPPGEHGWHRLPPCPSWVEELEAALSLEAGLPRLLPEEPWLPRKVDGFLYVIEPLLTHAMHQAREGVRELLTAYPAAPLELASGVSILFTRLPQRLFSMLHRTLLLELQAARLQGTLEGETPEHRFSSFVRRLREPRSRRELLGEYPVLSRQLTLGVRYWLEAGLEFLERLCLDWPVLQERFFGAAEPGALIAAPESGDLHRRGRAVRLLEFSSGQRLVYKPRPMSVDVHFQRLLAWLEARGGGLPLRAPGVLDRGAYGWMEFVHNAPCRSTEELGRFYERQGRFLALLHALQSTDMHFENLIACGEHPMLVDLEAIIQPRLTAEEAGDAQGLARRTLSTSVLRVSLLPQRVWRASDEGYAGIDISGLEAQPGQLEAERTLHWEEEGADTMRVVRRRERFEGGKNRPSLWGAEGSALEHAEALLEGFTGMYRLLMRHREGLLAEDGPLACFAQDQTRVLIRHTSFYSRLLEESFHPDVMREALDRDRLFDRLWRGIEHAPSLSRVIASEHEDLWAGDVPCFTTRPGTRDLWDSAGRHIEGFLSESGLETVRRGVAQLSEEELCRQRWFIRASLCTLAPQHSPRAVPSTLVEPPRPPSREVLISTAEAIAERLGGLSLRGKDDAAWLGLTPALSVEPLGLDLYDGVPGVALFLAFLENLTGKQQYGELGRAAWMTVRRQLESGQRLRLSVGAWTGLGGLLYTVSHLRRLWNEPVLEAEAERLLETLAGIIDEDAELDLMGGSAGCILALGVLRQAMPGLAERALALAVRCGERLLSRARKLTVGIGWGNASLAPQPLSGLAHGAAGFVLALLELAAATGDSRFREAALAALAYERSLFSREMGNWRDLREPRESYSMGWCHGAPGIGLSRLCALPFLDDEALRAELAAALETTSAHGFGMNHSLCHGDLGNLELLLKAAEVLKDGDRWRQQASRRAATILRSIQESGWQCGTPSRVEVPGLMTGLAGIGYGLLRLAEPQRVPSVLVLEPPSQGTSACYSARSTASATISPFARTTPLMMCTSGALPDR